MRASGMGLSARRAGLVAVALAAGCAIALLPASGGDSRAVAGTDPGTRTVVTNGVTEVLRTVPSHWSLTGVGRGGRSLLLTYEGGGCLQPDGRAVVHRTRFTIVLTVTQSELDPAASEVDGQPGIGVICPDYMAFLPLRVRLQRPIHGEPVERAAGTTWLDQTAPASVGMVRRVPRVVGLGALDALALLSLEEFNVRTRGVPNGRVVSQSPAPGTTVPYTWARRHVTLTLVPNTVPAG